MSLVSRFNFLFQTGCNEQKLKSCIAETDREAINYFYAIIFVI